jgi:hypothetical protein
LNPELKAELLKRLDQLALNPLENGLETEARVAREQYAALIQYSESPNGLAAQVERDRRKELESYTRSRALRILARAGRLWRRGPGRDTEAVATLRSELEIHRRAAAHERYLEKLLASSPRPEVVRDPDEVRQVVEALPREAARDSHAARLIADVFERSGDAEVRIACLRGLQRLDIQEARNQLLRLSQDPGTPDTWRAITLAYLNGEPEPVQAGVAGQP